MSRVRLSLSIIFVCVMGVATEKNPAHDDEYTRALREEISSPKLKAPLKSSYDIIQEEKEKFIIEELKERAKYEGYPQVLDRTQDGATFSTLRELQRSLNKNEDPASEHVLGLASALQRTQSWYCTAGELRNFHEEAASVIRRLPKKSRETFHLACQIDSGKLYKRGAAFGSLELLDDSLHKCPHSPYYSQAIDKILEILCERPGTELIQGLYASAALRDMELSGSSDPKRLEKYGMLVGRAEHAKGEHQRFLSLPRSSIERALYDRAIRLLSSRDLMSTLGISSRVGCLVLDDKEKLLKEMAAHDAADIAAVAKVSGDVIPHLGRALLDFTVDDGDREKAVRALGESGNLDAVPFLLKALNQRRVDGKLRRYAVEGLGELRGNSKESVPALVKVLTADFEGSYVRNAAARSLGKFGRDAQVADAALTEMIGKLTEDDYLRISAAQALAQIAPESKSTLATLLAAIEKNSDMNLKKGFLLALGLLGENGQAAIPYLKKEIEEPKRDKEEPHIRGAVKALGRISGNSALPYFQELLSGTKRHIPNHQTLAAAGIGAIKTKEAYSVLLRLFRDGTREETARSVALEGIRLSPYREPSVVREVIPILADRGALKMEAVQLLGSMGREAKEALDALKKLRSELKPDDNLRFAVEWAIEEIE